MLFLCGKTISLSVCSSQIRWAIFFSKKAIRGEQVHLSYDGLIYWRTVASLCDLAMRGHKKKSAKSLFRLRIHSASPFPQRASFRQYFGVEGKDKTKI
jgi:hypothetical protein